MWVAGAFLARLLVLLAGLNLVYASSAGGQAWPLTEVVQVPVPVLVKVFTSSKDDYNTLNTDLELQLRLFHLTSVAFQPALAFCKDIILELKGMPSPKACATNDDGSTLRIRFYRDHALRPATNAFFVIEMRYIAPSALEAERRIHAQLYDDYREIDAFGFTMPDPTYTIPGSELGLFQVSTSAATPLSSATRFTLDVTLASSFSPIDPGQSDSVLIWLMPLGLWDLSVLNSCIVEIASASGTGGGTCVFRRFPFSPSPEAEAVFGVNVIEIFPTEKITSAPLTFRIRIISPASGGCLKTQVTWYAQTRRGGKPSQQLVKSSGVTVDVQMQPTASMFHVSNAAINVMNEVTLLFSIDVTYRGLTRVSIVAPSSFRITEANVDVLGHSRIGGGGNTLGNGLASFQTAVLDVPAQGVMWQGAQYAVRLKLVNPSVANLPSVCSKSMESLSKDPALLSTLSYAAFTSAAPEAWSLSVEVGIPAEVKKTVNFMGFNVLPELRGANILPESYNLGTVTNTLQIFFRLSMSLATTHAAVKLEGPPEFEFHCISFKAPASPLTAFPAVSSCSSMPGLLLLKLTPEQFFPNEGPLSFSVAVKNPDKVGALTIEQKTALANGDSSVVPLGQLTSYLYARRSWALFVTSKDVPCQLKVDLESPYKGASWQLFQQPLFIDSLTTSGTAPEAEVFINIHYRFSTRLFRNSVIKIYAPYGFRFLSNFDVETISTGATLSLPANTPIKVNEKDPHILDFKLIATTREGEVYGFRGKVRNPQASSATQNDPAPNVWSMTATAPSGDTSLSERYDAGITPGYILSALEACEVQPVEQAFTRPNEVKISFIVHTSVYSTSNSKGSIQISAPKGYSVPEQCLVFPPLPTLDKPKSSEPEKGFNFFVYDKCGGNNEKASIVLDQASAILKGSHVRFRLSLVNPLEVPQGSNKWTIETFQGFRVLESCEVDGFVPTRTLGRATYEAGGAGEDLRPARQSVYRLAFIYPEYTPDEEAANDLALKAGTARSTIKLTVPEGFKTLASCLNGASGSNVLDGAGASLPAFSSCVGGGRTATFTLAGLVRPGTLYALSVTLINPPSAFKYTLLNAKWLLQVDQASSGALEPPSIRLLQEPGLVAGDFRGDSTNHWAKLFLQTATAVPIGGGLNALIPYEFGITDCQQSDWGLFDADDDPLGGRAVAPGTPCTAVPGVSAGAHHRITLFPLTEPLARNKRFILAVRVSNGKARPSNSEDAVASWSLYTADTQGEVIDVSNDIPTYVVKSDIGSLTLTPPALSALTDQALLVDVAFSLNQAVKKGALLFYPPPAVRVQCVPFGPQTMLPPRSECSVKGNHMTWEDQHLDIINTVFPWAASALYFFQLEIFTPDYDLPYYRRNWRVVMLTALSPTADGSLEGFDVASRAVPIWHRRGKLYDVVVRNANPALTRPYNTYFEFTTNLPLTDKDAELWIRAPNEITIHSFTCRIFISAPGAVMPDDRKLIPRACETVMPVSPKCTPFVWETEPCGDAKPNVAQDTREYAHRHGLRLVLGKIPAGGSVKLAVLTTPFAVMGHGSEDSRNLWTISTWQGNYEADVAQVPGYPVLNWIDVTHFQPSSWEPAADVTINVEWWMQVVLPARGRVAVFAPTLVGGAMVHELSNAAQRFDPGNLPTGETVDIPPEPPTIEAFSTYVEVTSCCMLDKYTRYRFGFGVRHAPFELQAAPSRPDLNIWSLVTYLPKPSTQALHQQLIEGYGMRRQLETANVELYVEQEVGGVTASDLLGLVQVKTQFMLPFGTLLMGPMPQLRLTAPRGWEFPAICAISDVKLGPTTYVDNCRAADRTLTLVLSGPVNPGMENVIFSFVAAVKPPDVSVVNDIWVLRTFAPHGSRESLAGAAVDLAQEAKERAELSGGEVSLRNLLVMLGLSGDSRELPKDDFGGYVGSERRILTWITVAPRPPFSLIQTWQVSTEFVATVKMMLPISAFGLTNATLRIVAPIDFFLFCSFPPNPFDGGNLPPGILCIDVDKAQERYALEGGARYRVDNYFKLALVIDDLIPLRPGTDYNFNIAMRQQRIRPIDPPKRSRWPAETAWMLELETGSDQFRTSAAATASSEGAHLPLVLLRDCGLRLPVTKANELTVVSILFTVNSPLLLPASFEIQPPASFRLDSTPSPFHPALEPGMVGVNPFSVASWEKRLEFTRAAGQPCPFFRVLLEDDPTQTVDVMKGKKRNASICEEPPTMDDSLLRSCIPVTYTALPKEQAKCMIFAGKAVVTVYRHSLNARNVRRGEYCKRDMCDDRFDLVRFPVGQYRLGLRVYNPSVRPSQFDDVWTLTVRGEVPVIGGGENNTVATLAQCKIPRKPISDIDGQALQEAVQGMPLPNQDDSAVDGLSIALRERSKTRQSLNTSTDSPAVTETDSPTLTEASQNTSSGGS